MSLGVPGEIPDLLGEWVYFNIQDMYIHTKKDGRMYTHTIYEDTYESRYI